MGWVMDGYAINGRASRGGGGRSLAGGAGARPWGDKQEVDENCATHPSCPQRCYP